MITVLSLNLKQKHLSNSWRTPEIPLINCEINLITTWSARCFIINAPTVGEEPTFTTTDTKFIFQL